MRLVPNTIRGQITIIILLALLTVITAGRALERWAKDDYAAPDLENMAERVNAVATVLKTASPLERDMILNNARRAGWDLALAPASIERQFTQSSALQGNLGAMVDWLFPPDGPAPVGGWRTFLNDRRVIASRVDSAEILVLSGFPDSILTSSLLGQGSYYIVAFIVLIVFFFMFAIRAITEPIKRISEAADDSDIANSSQIFEENGSIEIIALARALNGMRNRIRVMVESRTRMLRGVGHDLRTPLTRLRLRAERMEEGPLRDALLSDIVRIDSLLAESLNYLRDDYAIEPIQRSDIASVVQTVCSEFADVGFCVCYEGPNKMVANCKPLAMTRAITNLCDNAAKFAQNVIVELHEFNQGFVLQITDDGPGISDELKQRVFEPFFKGNTARGGSAGFGLGLSIVEDIVHAHRGTVELISRKPQGLSVKITIP